MDKNLEKKGVALEYLTIGWNLLAAIAAFAAGTIAGSIALIGFGLNGIADSVSSIIFLRQFLGEQRERDDAEGYGVGDRKSLFTIGITFFLLALYLLNESGSRLYYGEQTETSVVGLALAILSIISMIILSLIKVATKSALDRGILRYRARKTAERVFLSFLLLLGVGLHLRLEWWWADPVATLLMLPIIFFEGWEAIEASKTTVKSESTGTRS